MVLSEMGIAILMAEFGYLPMLHITGVRER
jgi:hypothetical protein